MLKMKVKLMIKHQFQRLSKKQTNCSSSVFIRRFQVATDLIISDSRLLEEIMIELEELIPGACSPLKKVRNVAAESVSDALIGGRLRRSRRKTSVLSQDSFESDGFLMQIDEIEKNHMSSRDKIPNVETPTNTDNGKVVLVEAPKGAERDKLNVLSVRYKQQNAMISRAVSYELKLYADFVFNSEEERR
ncbi:hypothetical protein Cgig2_029764 [Carnegiea gigantea]|uniref:Uncharacterized protein n=1 Tax=Carnegiea gigantea TaxID=171969 RepID=A0A9Q1QBM3_9CARY|nr:hypothetical protein Cgig2_029764 [Carnegiea gigantea]